MEKRYNFKRKPRKCPCCGSKIIASYLYGMPDYTEELKAEIEAGKTVLGGCIMDYNKPMWRCHECKTEFYQDIGLDFL